MERITIFSNAKQVDGMNIKHIKALLMTKSINSMRIRNKKFG